MLAAYNTVPGTMQRRTPQRSIIHPISGQLSAPIVECAVSAIENVPRPIPSSAVIGFRKTPKEKTLIGPAPTISANTVAATTHQRFAKAPLMPPPPRSLLPAVCGAKPTGATSQTQSPWPGVTRPSTSLVAGAQASGAQSVDERLALHD